MFSGLSISVIDPLNRTGKVSIPAHQVSDTKGLDDYRTAAAKRENKDFSLCLLFQKGRCNAGARCHQIHASPEFVSELRAQASKCKNCCAEHGDLHSHGYADASQTIILAAADGQEQRFTLSSFARTACLDSVLRSVKSLEIKVPANKICRLHSQRRCKFGKDCKNVHLCPDAVELPSIRKGCPSIDMNVSCCGISSRSTSTSKPASMTESPNSMTPRDGCAEAKCLAASAPLSVDRCEATMTTDGGCSSFFFSDEKIWGGDSSSSFLPPPNLDMSVFEATIRSLCEDLDRAEVSPGSAIRVRTQMLIL